MPFCKRGQLSVCERVLGTDGSIATILLDQRYAPYQKQEARIENLCGSFTEYTLSAPLKTAIFKGCGQQELFHLHGNVTINQGRASFLAVRSMEGLGNLSRALHLSSPRNVVHMAVLTSKLGRRVQVSSAGALESFLRRHNALVKETGRMFEQTNSVGFTVRAFDREPASIPAAFRPDGNDWTVTGKGMVLIRLTWKRVEWTQEIEDACLVMCNRMTEWLSTCC